MQFEVTGHAGYDESGRDIVCAGVSVLTNSAANMIEAFRRGGMVEEAYCYPHDAPQYLYVRYGKDKTIKTAMDTIAAVYRQMGEQYPKFVRVKND